LSDQLRRQLDQARERLSRHGASGIERALDDVLQGRGGVRHVERDKRAREMRQLGFESPRTGIDVVLTIDAELQALAESALTSELVSRADGHQPRDAALVVMTVDNGDLLVAAGQPREVPVPDPVTGTPMMVPLAHHPAGSWRTNGRVGSVLKPFFAAWALTVMPAFEAEFEPCNKTFRLRTDPTKVRECEGNHLHWDGRGVELAIGASCNVFFFQVALGIGRDGLEAALREFGFLADETDAARFAAEHAALDGLYWHPPQEGRQLLELHGIGYGLDASAISVARGYAALASGRLVTPRTVLEIGGQPTPVLPQRPLVVPPSALARVRDGLRLCTFDTRRGTARHTRLSEYGVVGKTGTPGYVGRQGQTLNNAWFAGYAPFDRPRVAFAVVVYGVEHGVHGGDVAAPLLERFLAEVAARPAVHARLFGEASRR
jgi:penicillin-binding protein 2